MTEKNLTEAAWKDLAKTRAKDLAPLFKTFEALSKAEKRGAEAELEVLKDIEKEAASLRKDNKGDKDVLGRLDDLDKALAKQRKASQEAQAEQQRLAAKQAEQQDEEDTPDLLTTKTAAALKEVRKGALVANVLIAVAGKLTKVMVSKKAISPARGKVLKEQMDNPSGLKFIRGECLFEENKITFVVQTQAAGLAKRLNAALLDQLDKRMKVRVRGEDPADVDEDPDAVEEDESEGEEGGEQGTSGKVPDAPPEPPDPLKGRFESRLEKLEPLVLAALRAQQGDTGKIRAVADFARGKGESKAYAAGLQALDTLEKLLAAAAPGSKSETPPQVPPQPPGQQGGGNVDPNVAFTARLTALMPKVKEGLAAGGELATDLKLKISEAGTMARKREFGPAQSLLDDAEDLLEQIVKAKAEPKADPQALQWENRLAATDKVFLRVLKGNPANATALRAVMSYAVEQAGDKEYAKALAALTRLDGLLEAAEKGGTGQPGQTQTQTPGTPPSEQSSDGGSGERPGEKGYKGIVAYRKSLVEFRQALGKVNTQIASLKKSINSEVPDESELADELAERLGGWTQSLQDAVDEAIKVSDNPNDPAMVAVAEELANYAKEVADDELIQHVDSSPFASAGMSIGATLSSALAGVRAAMPTPAS